MVARASAGKAACVELVGTQQGAIGGAGVLLQVSANYIYVAPGGAGAREGSRCSCWKGPAPVQCCRYAQNRIGGTRGVAGVREGPSRIAGRDPHPLLVLPR